MTELQASNTLHGFSLYIAIVIAVVKDASNTSCLSVHYHSFILYLKGVRSIGIPFTL